MHIISFRGAIMTDLKKKLQELFCQWKQRRWERAIESVTMAQFYHLRDEDIAELEKILEDARERLRDKTNEKQ